MSELLSITVKWSGSDYKIDDLNKTEKVSELKHRIYERTNVLPGRQKLLGLKCKGKQATDDDLIGDLGIKPNTKVMMMGTREEVLASAVEPPEDLPEVVDDFDIGDDDEISVENNQIYLDKIAKRIKDYKIDIINEPRPGKKLLVLDIDYTLFDHRSVGEKPIELMRPFLHEFLASAYLDYDIVIWSATNMKWIEVKMRELGVSGNSNYKLCFMVDSRAMISVSTSQYGTVDVKPLGVIWGKFPQWSSANTIMFDDIRRNFLMNPQSGLKIRPFKNCHFSRDTDNELLHLADYLRAIASLEDFTSLNHRYWERYLRK